VSAQPRRPIGQGVVHPTFNEPVKTYIIATILNINHAFYEERETETKDTMSLNNRASTINGTGSGPQVEKSYFESQRELLVGEIAQVRLYTHLFPPTVRVSDPIFCVLSIMRQP
jgi:hypothetical protein